MNYNRIILAGHVTRDPQLSYLPSQTAVVEFGLAASRKWKGQDGQVKEEVCFVDCRAYGKSAETLNQYVKKGSALLVEGRLQFDQWEKDGQKRSKHRVAVDSFQFGSKPDQSGESSRPTPRAQQPQQAQQESDPVLDSDIPF